METGLPELLVERLRHYRDLAAMNSDEKFFDSLERYRKVTGSTVLPLNVGYEKDWYTFQRAEKARFYRDMGYVLGVLSANHDKEKLA